MAGRTDTVRVRLRKAGVYDGDLVYDKGQLVGHTVVQVLDAIENIDNDDGTDRSLKGVFPNRWTITGPYYLTHGGSRKVVSRTDKTVLEAGDVLSAKDP